MNPLNEDVEAHWWKPRSSPRSSSLRQSRFIEWVRPHRPVHTHCPGSGRGEHCHLPEVLETLGGLGTKDCGLG